MIGSDANAKYYAYKTALGKVGLATTTTEPIFSSVTMNANINIPKTLAASGVTTVANDLTAITAAGGNLDTIAHGLTQQFECCEFKIKIEGYGIAAGTATELDGTIASTLKTKLG